MKISQAVVTSPHSLTDRLAHEVLKSDGSTFLMQVELNGRF